MYVYNTAARRIVNCASVLGTIGEWFAWVEMPERICAPHRIGINGTHERISVRRATHTFVVASSSDDCLCVRASTTECECTRAGLPRKPASCRVVVYAPFTSSSCPPMPRRPEGTLHVTISHVVVRVCAHWCARARDVRTHVSACLICVTYTTLATTTVTTSPICIMG